MIFFGAFVKSSTIFNILYKENFNVAHITQTGDNKLRDYEIVVSLVCEDRKQRKLEIFDISFLVIISSNFKVEDS